jgi:transcriptional regulator
VYQPAHGRFVGSDPAGTLAQLAAAYPATLVTLNDDGLRATILPMLYDRADGPHGTLRGHVARGNPQWRTLSGDTDALVIYNGPDAYVTPSWYEEKRQTGKVVPTWNYVTVQARGRIELRHEVDWLVEHVRRLVHRHEALRDRPWSVDDAPAGYIETQARAIVGLELRIAALDAKRKLSQNRSTDDMLAVIAGLATGDDRERAVADEMRRDG